MKFPHSLDQFQMGAIHKRAMLSSKVTLSRTSIHLIINHYHLESVVYWVAGRGLVFHIIQNLGKFLQLSGSLSEAVG